MSTLTPDQLELRRAAKVLVDLNGKLFVPHGDAQPNYYRLAKPSTVLALLDKIEDCDGATKAVIKINKFHLHELMDRIHCVSTMFDELIRDHAAASLIQKDIDNVSSGLGKLYQKAGALRFEGAAKPKS